MSISVYIPSGFSHDEAARSRAVEAAGLHLRTGDRELQSLVELAATYMGTPMAALSIVSGMQQHRVAAYGLEPGISARATSFCGHAVLAPDRILCVPDTFEDERFAGNPWVIEAPAIRFYAGAPLLSPDGFGLGTLCVFAPTPRPALRADEATVLRALADRVMALAGGQSQGVRTAGLEPALPGASGF